ncbi:hypothetical protein RP29_06030 [Acidovorax temperans]|uniref:Uncharacterized protein n=1 Tax=Acidovorax temperans TaxID=80878 RepID=A0A0D7KDM5_9BURK|nr:hypothetical protein RP29_06030 [Acidovorax temperans]
MVVSLELAEQVGPQFDVSGHEVTRPWLRVDCRPHLGIMWGIARENSVGEKRGFEGKSGVQLWPFFL